MSFSINEYITQVNHEALYTKNVIIGIDNTGRSTVLIRNTDSSSESVSFENTFFIMKNSIILEYNEAPIGNFHVLICKKTDPLSIDHFNRVCDYLFIKPDNGYTSAEMLKLFYSLETIFAVTGSHDRSLEIGLYGELSVINYFYDNNLGDLYKTWHVDFFNKHDFEINNTTKVEVKTTTNDIRIHSFRHNQIFRDGMSIYVIYSRLQPCEKGLTLYELCQKTISILDDNNQMLAIELLMHKLGLNATYQGVACIQEETYSNLALYNVADIPRITTPIPVGVSNVCYDVDFTGAKNSSFDIFL